MKVIIAALCFVALAVAAPPAPVVGAPPRAAQASVVPIVRSESNVEHDGSFQYSYESADGSQAEQTGELRVIDAEHQGVVSRGSFSYPGDDGQTYTLTYVADENGYQPQGAHLPVAPAIPEAIVRALEYISQHPHQEESHQGGRVNPRH